MDNAHAKLLQLVSKLVKTDAHDLNMATRLFEHITTTKGTVLVAHNKRATHLYFINSGFIRNYYLQDGLEVTSHINCPPGFITSFNSFINGTNSPEVVQCITDCDLLRITKKDLDTLYQECPNWGLTGRLIYEQALAYNEQRTKDIMTLTAKQRYLNLLAIHPDIIQHVPLQYIASFIGIKPESLSRIRKQIIS
ncbi:Crp/Fnr family transcriptional regulator [Chitinophaga niastensis]|nr:Crp/Fnr family transcriptional regulator [Chitinophaga niastensis]